ncbi:Cystatin domain-containing protein [Heracleum sosnowskyi]|uniref:Cystatin domain-containing protein n=1 Tax=Heracleum sosnowskyi TaxID=360622 RepID=A0AAD8IRQ8_9APIA|nr:Cystatin domain-containing protein [Heracleum sosnowskyi]
MAAKSHAILTLLLLSALAIASLATGLGGSGIVGGRTKISDVESNQEIQQLGKYSVTEYNRQQHANRHGDDGDTRGDLKFVKVVAAEKQVVAGIKYYLTIVAAKGGNKKTFDAEVVVQAWKKSKQLTSFAPSRN